ncbi:uncharacterized protein GIQ15_02003 [Arthroderma uncinatum]|uniref:uncharacterized protein n=1 Tax=Arthroderma uncinatum TaxID=74035 RepID=UPI00144A924F|nr:uncharacterized protein GIQ15_02003 [Arthroderma uncinatum]KAF3482679.1 hypothetical protein GIQ15_02003 [Arthroderma uncinatum]
MKAALPENAIIAKGAKECMQECVSEFISFITSEASEKCQGEKRKTVNGEDILFAMTSLGFENYAEALKLYLVKYRETKVVPNHLIASQPHHPGAANTVNAKLDPNEQDGAAYGEGYIILGRQLKTVVYKKTEPEVLELQ